jgi:hypothetical protein
MKACWWSHAVWCCPSGCSWLLLLLLLFLKEEKTNYENKVELKLSHTQQLLISANGVNLLGDNAAICS